MKHFPHCLYPLKSFTRYFWTEWERRSGKQLTAFREELEQLKTKYIVDNEYRKALSNRLGFFRKELLKAHPTIASPKFESALAELKEIVSEKSHKED